jgi:phenylalanyl-tRNA synthetase beta chain
VNATPNRGDCMSVFGITRDYVAAHERRYLTYSPTPVAAQSAAVFPVTIDIPAEVPVFTCRVIRGVTPGGKSPWWLRERLRRVGLNSISPMVDITNYVMTALGQPLHAYDLDKLAGGITVRLARAGERATLLDGKEYALDPDHVVITDADGVVGLGGIMGGLGSAISESTTAVLFEAAHFTPDSIAGRARRLGLFTDAAQRFERGVDPTLPARALELATALLLEIAGGEPGPVQVTGPGAVVDAGAGVTLRRARLSRLLGVTVADADVTALLGAISDRVEATTEGWRVSKPPHRFDVRIEADLIEEIARLRGFDSIDESPAIAPQIAGVATEARVSHERIFTAMADRGYREVITYSFVDPVLQRELFPDVPALALANAISAELSEMRVSLWTGLVQAASENLRRQQPRVRLFEIGKKFDRQSGQLREIETLAGIATGARWPEQWGGPREPLDFYDVKADLLGVLALTASTDSIRFEPATMGCLRPGRTARIWRESTPIGWLAEVHPQLVRKLSLPTNTLVFELEIESSFISNPLKVKSISKFPSIRRDLAIVIDEGVPLAVLRENVTVSASGLLSELRVFDVYCGPGIETGRKSIALGLILQDSSRTLTDVDADTVVASVVARLRDVLSASIRD